ncbi:hypothetical protein WICPIJ_004059, partial [Wickerhamomyces pijperi]
FASRSTNLVLSTFDSSHEFITYKLILTNLEKSIAIKPSIKGQQNTDNETQSNLNGILQLVVVIKRAAKQFFSEHALKKLADFSSLNGIIKNNQKYLFPSKQLTLEMVQKIMLSNHDLETVKKTKFIENVENLFLINSNFSSIEGQFCYYFGFGVYEVWTKRYSSSIMASEGSEKVTEGVLKANFDQLSTYFDQMSEIQREIDPTAVIMNFTLDTGCKRNLSQSITKFIKGTYKPFTAKNPPVLRTISCGLSLVHGSGDIQFGQLPLSIHIPPANPMFRRLPLSLTKRPLTPQLLQQRTFTSSTQRFNKQTNNKSEKSVNFRNFISVGIISTIILVQVVDAVNDSNTGNRNAGRSMSEHEYARQQARLKRKKAVFDEDDIEVKFLWSDKGISRSLSVPGYQVINPLQLIEEEKQNKESRFYDLLNEKDFVIPRGLVNDLVKNKLLAEAGKKKKFIVVVDDALNYDMKDFIQFEDKVKTIDKFVVLNSDTLHDAQRYYQTVKKVAKIDSLDQLSEN